MATEYKFGRIEFFNMSDEAQNEWDQALENDLWLKETVKAKCWHKSPAFKIFEELTLKFPGMIAVVEVMSENHDVPSKAVFNCGNMSYGWHYEY